MIIPDIHFKYLILDDHLFWGEEKMKKIFLCAITLVITGLVITSGAVSIMHSGKNIVLVKQIGIEKKITSMDMSVSFINSVKPTIKKQMTTTLSYGADVLVHHDPNEYDVQNPALVTDAGLSNILIFTESLVDIGQTGLWGRFSTDMGQTWDDNIYGFEAIPSDDPDDVSQPRLDYYQDSWAYGTWSAGGKYDAMIYYLELPNIVDPDYAPNGYGWVYYSVDWSDVASFTNFDSADVACYPYNAAYSPSAEFWGIIVGTGDRPASDFNPPENNTVWLQYNVPGSSVVLWWFYNIIGEDCEKIACDIDISIHQTYFVCEYYMEEDPSDNGSMFFKIPKLRPDNYPNDNWIQDGSFTGLYFEDVLTPDIVAVDGSVYIVGSLDDDIVCMYSDDEGDSFQQSIVSDDAGVETYPQVTLVGSDVICTYTRGGNYYVKVSDDGGVSWGAEVKINDEDGTVVEQYGCTGIDGPSVSWTDGRDAPPTEIYFDSIYSKGNPPSAPQIWGPPRHGKPVLKSLLGKLLPRPLLKPGTLYNFIFNSIDPDGDQVRYIIDWGDATSNITDFYPSGTNVTLLHTWNYKGVYTIRARAQDSTGLIGPETERIYY